MKVKCGLLLMVFVLSGCVGKKIKKACPSLRWQNEGTFSSYIELPRWRLWSVGIRTFGDSYPELVKLADLEVQCTVTNTGSKVLKFAWMADCKQEKQAGELVVKYDNFEKRKIYLKPGQELLWYAGKMGRLVDSAYLSVQDLDETKTWKLLLQLEFKNPERLKDLVSVSELEIPLSAWGSYNGL